MSRLISVERAKECCDGSKRQMKKDTSLIVSLALTTLQETAAKFTKPREAKNFIPEIIEILPPGPPISILPRPTELPEPLPGVMIAPSSGADWNLIEMGFFDQGTVVNIVDAALDRALALSRRQEDKCVEKRALPQDSRRAYSVRRGQYRVR